MLKKLKTRKILLELLILLSLIFSWSILEGNVRLNYYLETIIGNKIGIAQNFNTIASDINAGKVIIKTYPDKDTLDQISNFPEVEYMSVSTPAYVVQDNLSENDPLKHIKLIGGNQPFPYDLFIEKILLIDGRVFNQQEITQESNVALISENFARKNNLKIGDSYNIKAIGNRFEHEHEHEHEHDSTDHDDIILIPIEIIGIFKANTTSLVSQDSKESQFYTNLLSTNIYITNNYAKIINSKLLTKQIETSPAEFENIKDFYGNTITDNDKLLKHLESFQTYEISIVPKNNRATNSIKDKLASKLKLFPYVKVLYSLERYDVYQIFPQITISIVVISFISLVTYYVYSFSNIRNNKQFIKHHILSIMLSFVLGIGLSNYCSNIYINYISQYSPKFPIQDDIPIYNNLDKIKLTTINMIELRSVPMVHEFLVYLSLIFIALILSFLIYKLKKYRDKKYVRLT
ncbi:hypothetical protein J5581_00850 [Streptococcus suis]|uniref:hypothetical protein n=1 Tax=Streptococcus suis TaxID=1307 RepID=UPI000CF4E54A|nr:hypothetical protein [Streptococcus suis]MBM7280941.1 hypothetical protein [Streptococcus suis]MBO4134444.1 hypothetical protein [Streptococcus suis]